MNIIHMKYAVEVAKVGSINKASENLSMAQPNISRAIKDLESDLNITIFDRSAKGMNLTPEGKEFIAYAQKILSQLNELENMFKSGIANKQRFSLSTPRSGYIAEAFSLFSKNIDGDSAEIILDETGTANTIKKVLNSDAKLGIIRYDEGADKYFKEMLRDNGILSEDIASFKYVILMSKSNLLNERENVVMSDLKEFIQITHQNPYAATLSVSDEEINAPQENADRCIYVLDSAAQLELLSENNQTFMWVSPSPDKLLERYNLAEKDCVDNHVVYKDVLIYRKGYKLSDTDKMFIDELKKSAERYLK